MVVHSGRVNDRSWIKNVLAMTQNYNPEEKKHLLSLEDSRNAKRLRILKKMKMKEKRSLERLQKRQIIDEERIQHVRILEEPEEAPEEGDRAMRMSLDGTSSMMQTRDGSKETVDKRHNQQSG